MDTKFYLNLISVLLWYILGMFYLALFLYNFFPINTKISLSTISAPKYINNISINYEKVYQSKLDRLVLVVIDALRKDFITKEKMPYIYSEINKPKNCLLSAKAESPTVTMPRIKAMTTGSVPQFIDVILNFVSTKVVEDSVLHQAFKLGKKIVFYGDETWLKLFPNLFTRSEGTTSFYVTDFTEVDNNITRHLKKELYQNTDWDILILHYLGLDHIGHVHGPFHPLIKIKLNEMDNIVDIIHSSVKEQERKTAILICGDHGMRDSGGHGGSSEPETLIPLIFLEMECNTRKKFSITQTDVAPTLAALLGLPLPADNIGKIITQIMNTSTDYLLYLLHYNALNLLHKNYEKYYEDFRDIFEKHANYLKQRSIDGHKLIETYEDLIFKLSNELIKSSTQQNLSILYLSFSSLIVVTISLSLPEFQSFFIKISLLNFIFLTIVIFVQNCTKISLLFCLMQFVAVFVKIPNLFKLLNKFCSSSPLLFFLINGMVIRTILLMSSSFVEEEHQIWYFLWGSAIALGFYYNLKARKSWKFSLYWFMLFVGLRSFRNLNRTGVKNSLPDIADWLKLPQNYFYYSTIFVIGLIGVAYSCTKVYRHDKIINILSIMTVYGVFNYQTALYYDKHIVYEARLTLGLILLTGIISFLKYNNIFTIMWMLWMSLLMRPYNVILLPICFGASKLLFLLISCKKTLCVFHLWLGYLFFHYQGFCNSLASIDISPGYIGLTEYSVFLTSLQVFCHTYTFPVFSIVLLLSNYSYNEQLKMLHFIVIFRFFSITWYCLVILIHRQHLFIWSVFSPKLLIESCHVINLFLILLIYLIVIIFYTTKKQLNIVY